MSSFQHTNAEALSSLPLPYEPLAGGNIGDANNFGAKAEALAT